MITKIKQRIRCFTYMEGKTFVIMAQAKRTVRRAAPSGTASPINLAAPSVAAVSLTG